jgi:hypothetical protein
MPAYLQEALRGNYLRYQFDSAAQVLRHCRLVNGRVLLFFPDCRPPLAVHARALIELSLTGAGQQVALPAQVQAFERGPPAGEWLAMRALGIVAGLHLVGAPRRKQRRLAFDQLAWVEHEGGPVLACPVLDVSRGGARLWGIPGTRPAEGEPVRVRLPGAPTLIARIAWAHGREVGVAFAQEGQAVAERVYQRVEQMWSDARLAAHDPHCPCAEGGAALDPPLPRIKDLRLS